MTLAHRVEPGKRFRLADIDPEEKGPFDDKKDPRVQKRLDAALARLCELQELLYAEGKQGLLVVLQAMDTAGKDGVLRVVVGPLDSRGTTVVGFKSPNSEELGHDYLWRVHRHAPAKGQVVIFNRSHYEDVLVVRVLGLAPKERWSKRFDHIVAFEKLLADEGTRVVKIFLHISKDEQKRRLVARLEDPSKRWKWDARDLDMRKKWDDFQEAYEDALERTSSDHAPWYVVPANRKWFRDVAVSELLVDVLEDMAPKPPKIDLDPKKIVIPD